MTYKVSSETLSLYSLYNVNGDIHASKTAAITKGGSSSQWRDYRPRRPPDFALRGVKGQEGPSPLAEKIVALVNIIMFFITIADKRCKGQSATSAMQDSTL